MDVRLVELLEHASWRVGTVNLFVLWLRSFALAFGVLWLALLLVGVLGQTNVRLHNEAFLVVLLVLAVVAAVFATKERDRRLLLLRALEECYDEPAGGSAPPDRTPA